MTPVVDSVVEGHILKGSSSANLDYEFAERHAVVVNSTDSGSPPLSVSETFVIQVLDVNEGSIGCDSRQKYCH